MSHTTSYYENQLLFPLQIQTEVPADLQISVVIPFRSDNNLMQTIASLNETSKDIHSEVIVVFYSYKYDEDSIIEINHRQYYLADKWRNEANRNINLELVNFIGIPQQWEHSDIGRKIGMDEALSRLDDARNPNGVIISLDAGVNVETPFFNTILKHFEANNESLAANIDFRFPDGDHIDENFLKASQLLELRYRYYHEGLRYAGCRIDVFPFSFAFAIRAWAYKEAGGLPVSNRSVLQLQDQVGALGKVNKITETHVQATLQTRAIADRLQRMAKSLNSGKPTDKIYAPECFDGIKILNSKVPAFYSADSLMAFQNILRTLPPDVIAFLGEHNFFYKWRDLKQESRNLNQFLRDFYLWFDGDLMLKLVQFSAAYYKYYITPEDAAAELLQKAKNIRLAYYDLPALLQRYRLLSTGMQILNAEEKRA